MEANKAEAPAHGEETVAPDAVPRKHEGTVLSERIQQQHSDLYYEALERFGRDGDIDPVAEKKLRRSVSDQLATVTI